MGKDKVENEELIKYGDDDDVWFHVDKVRMGEQIELDQHL
jgi:hypothetical protein